jgi:hypothetical protein
MIKHKLQSGVHVHGYQYLLFLYTDLKFDPEKSWDGLLRNEVQLSWYDMCQYYMHIAADPQWLEYCRHAIMSSYPPVPLT